MWYLYEEKNFTYQLTKWSDCNIIMTKIVMMWYVK